MKPISAVRTGLRAGLEVLGELWRTRRVLVSLWRNELRGRYAGTLGGLAWAVVSPLVMIAVYTVIFSSLVKAKLPGVPEGPGGFGFYVVAGILAWLPLQQSLATAPSQLLANGPTVRRFVLAPSLMPFTTVLTAFTDMAAACGLFLIVLAATTGLEAARLAVLVPAVLLLALLVLGLSLAACAINLYGRDVAHFVTTFTTLWFFASPIAYPASLLPPSLRWILYANPLTGLVETFRYAMLPGTPMPWAPLTYSFVFVLGAFALGAHVFQETRRDFVDLL